MKYYHQHFINQSLGNYGGTPNIKFKYKKVEYKGTFFKHDAYYKVLYNKTRDIFQIYFKETSSKSQWLANFNFPKAYYDSFQFEGKDIQLRVARGWSALYNALKHYIRDEYRELLKTYGKKDLEIIGWSLGSAIAQLCAQDLFFNYNVKAYVYTFGSVKPWFGKNSDMRDYLSKCYIKCYNFRNKEDIVGYMVPLPNYFALNHITLNAEDEWHFLNLFNPQKYHTIYYKEELYENIED